MKYKACIFDLDGTLANTLHSIAWFANAALRDFGFPPIDPESYKLMVGNGADTLLRRMLHAVNGSLTEEEFLRFRAAYDGYYEAEPMKLVTACTGMPEALEQLREKGLLLGVLSNKPDNMTRHIVEALYGKLPQAVQGQLPGIPKKPDPTALLQMAEALGVPPHEVLYVGDSGVDMQTGSNAGMDTCGVLWGFRPKAELEEHAACFLASTAGEFLTLALTSR